MDKTYSIKAFRAAADVEKNNVEHLGSGYSLEDAARVSQLHMKTGWFVSVWIVAEEAPKPRITRSVETDFDADKGRKRRHVVTRCDGWMI